MDEPIITYDDEEVRNDDGKVIGLKIFNITRELEAYIPTGLSVYSVGYNRDGIDRQLRGFFEANDEAVAEATRIIETEGAWVQLEYDGEVIWDNGDELDDDEVPLSFRVMIKHMVAEGLVTERDEWGRRHLTPKGKKRADEWEKTQEGKKYAKAQREQMRKDATEFDVLVYKKYRGKKTKYTLHGTFDDPQTAVAEADRLVKEGRLVAIGYDNEVWDIVDGHLVKKRAH